MKKYLVGISYHDSESYDAWTRGVIEDYESSTGLFVMANSKSAAISWGEVIGEKLFQKENPEETEDWKSFEYGCWIEDDWKNSGWSHCLDFFQTINYGEFPDLKKMGSTAYSEWLGNQKGQKSDFMWSGNGNLSKMVWKHHVDSIPIYIGMIFLVLLVVLMYYIDTLF